MTGSRDGAQQLGLPEVQGMLWLHADLGLDLRPLGFGGGCFLLLPEPNIWHLWDDEETETWGKRSVGWFAQ